MMNIPSGKPILPQVEKLLPYLHRIDDARYYSNMGPLVREYEERLAKHFGCEVVATSNCTSALVAALLGLELPEGSGILVPSYTFVGTIEAILSAGFIPVFEDIEPSNYQINPNAITYSLKANPSIRAVLVVSPFGEAVDMEGWGRIADAYKVSVLVDAAGGFDTTRPGKIPVCISTHATKVFSTAEGGLILSTDAEFIKRARICQNFGIEPDRSINRRGYNSKMSEYHAAVGLAELDGWQDKRAQWVDAKTRYVDLINDILPVHRYNIGTATSLIPFNLCNESAKTLEKLNEKGVAARQIWGKGCHVLPPFLQYPRFPMKETDRIADQVITIPFFIDMTNEEMDYVAEALRECL